MASCTESEVEVDETQCEASSSCSTSAISGVGKKKKSKVWMYFQKIKNSDGSVRGDCVKCTECGKSIKTKTGNTTNLLSHLNIKHPNKYADVKKKTEEEKKRNAKRPRERDLHQVTFKMMAKKKAKLETSSGRYKKITEKIAGVLIHDFQPFSFVEDRGFKKLMEELEPRYEIPSRTSFSRSVIPRIYKEVKEQVKSKVVDLQQRKNKVALTTDMWSSEANESYLGLSCHYLTHEFELVSVCLAVEHFSGRHTGVNIAAGIRHILSDYAIDQSAVSAVIADNASNMDLALRLGEWRSRHCFGHTLQLAINDGLKMSLGVQDMIKSAKAIVAFFHRSTKATEKLKGLQVQLKLPANKIITDCPTRWNSTYYMLQRLLEQKAAITVMCSSSGGPRASLSVSEWSILEELVQILKPLEEATRELSVEQTVSASKVIPLLNAILHELQKNVVDDDETQIPESQDSSASISEDCQQVVSGLIQSIETRWIDYENDDIYSISTLLDPRFKEVSFSALALDRAKKLLLTLMRRVNADEAHSSADNAIHVISDNEDAPDSAEKKSLWDSFEEELKKKKASHHLVTQHNKDEHELALYLCVPYIDRKDNPLNWWKMNKGQFPILSDVAREYLAIPAMSTPSERLFSAAGYISCRRRSSLNGEHIHQLVFLNKNM